MFLIIIVVLGLLIIGTIVYGICLSTIVLFIKVFTDLEITLFLRCKFSHMALDTKPAILC
jgi:fatty-acid desaturase